MIDILFEYTFMQNAVLSAILSSIACGIIGTIIMEKKLVMMSGGIAHTAFGGVGMGYYLKIEPIIGAFCFSIAAALGIARINRRTNTHTDLLIGMFWSVGMALGIIFIALTPGYPPDMSSYLFGDILTVSRLDIGIMIVLDIIITSIICLCFNAFKAYLFDEEFARISGVSTVCLENLLYILVALTVVIMIRVVGIILIIALLCAPPAIAKEFSNDLKKIMFLAVGGSIVFSLSGLWLSYNLHLASGACIILVSVLTYAVVSTAKYLLQSLKKDTYRTVERK